MKNLELIIHKPPMKTLLKFVVRANTIQKGLELINAQYPYPIFDEKDIITNQFLTSKQVEKVWAEVKKQNDNT